LKLAERSRKNFRLLRFLDTEPMMAAMGIKKPNHGFTLVELMIAIVIIGILMAIAIPAVNRSIITARQAAIRMEVNALNQAVEQYMLKYGDYPPDGSDKDILARHMRKLFPRMSPKDTTLLRKLTDANEDNSSDQSFSATAMDRAEALVFFLGGFSDNVLNPLTGEGGPLALRPGVANPNSDNIADYQYNGTRDNSFFDFDPSRLTLRRVGGENGPLMSNDEELFGYTTAPYGGVDPLPAYVTRVGAGAPMIYFDSRSYGRVTESDASGVVTSRYNGYASPNFGAIRPYKTLNNAKPPRNGTAYSNEDEAFAAIQFQNPSTFQIIAPGLDGLFGSLVDNAALPVHFVTETGEPVFPNVGASGVSGLRVVGTGIGPRFQEGGTDVSGHLDNITNFSTSTLEDDLQ